MLGVVVLNDGAHLLRLRERLVLLGKHFHREDALRTARGDWGVRREGWGREMKSERALFGSLQGWDVTRGRRADGRASGGG